MRSMPRPVILSHALLAAGAAVITLALNSEAPSAQAMAGGAPYADPAYCSALPDLIRRFEGTILPQQARDLAGQEARLRDAESGANAAEQDFNSALRDGIIKLGTDQIASAKILRERVQAMNRSGMNAEARRAWLQRIKSIEDFGERLKSGAAVADYKALVDKNQAGLVEFMKFVDDSGAADIALKGLADMVAPGVGGMVVGGIKVGLDVAYAGLNGRFTAQEAAQWRENVDRLRSAHRDLVDRVNGYRDDLTSGLCGPRVAQQTQNSPRPIPPAEAAAPPPPPPPPAAPVVSAPAPTGPSMGKILGWTALLTGSIVGGAYVYEQAQLLAEETATFSTPTSSGNPTSTGTPSSSASTITAYQITCTLSSAGTFRNCVGFITATIGPSVTAGVALIARTFPSEVLGRVTPSSTGAGQSLRFEISTSSTAACQTISGANFVRASDVNTAFASASRSLTVTCN